MEPELRTLPILLPQGFVDLAYAQWGPRGGRVVVCAHGLTRNARDFDVVARALAGAGRRVVAVDFPGRGRSSWLAGPAQYGFPVYLGAMAALLARLDVDELDWIGTSMGGLAGMMLAAQPRTPLTRLVVNDVGPFIPKASLERIGSYVGETPRRSARPSGRRRRPTSTSGRSGTRSRCRSWSSAARNPTCCCAIPPRR
jgi:pimeloyl-ACP methyl ester carboxylesterase